MMTRYPTADYWNIQWSFLYKEKGITTFSQRAATRWQYFYIDAICMLSTNCSEQGNGSMVQGAQGVSADDMEHSAWLMTTDGGPHVQIPLRQMIRQLRHLGIGQNQVLVCSPLILSHFDSVQFGRVFK